MKRALVIRNIVDLNAEPSFEAERKSQLLFGERVSVHSERNGYSEVEQLDGYRGWSPCGAICEVNEADWKKLDRAFVLRVSSPVAEVFADSDSPVPPYFLSYGSLIYPAPEEGNDTQGDPAEKRIEIASPDNIRRWIRSEDLTQVQSEPTDSESFRESSGENFGENIVMAAMQFLGVPYVWGGRSSLGLDCSGLTQLVCSLNGVELPRDSCDQRKIGTEAPREQLQLGDLIFSEGHVVIYIGEEQFLHASQREGGVTINSYSAAKSNYRKDLDKGFQIARRLV